MRKPRDNRANVPRDSRWVLAHSHQEFPANAGKCRLNPGGKKMCRWPGLDPPSRPPAPHENANGPDHSEINRFSFIFFCRPPRRSRTGSKKQGSETDRRFRQEPKADSTTTVLQPNVPCPWQITRDVKSDARKPRRRAELSAGQWRNPHPVHDHARTTTTLPAARELREHRRDELDRAGWGSISSRPSGRKTSRSLACRNIPLYLQPLSSHSVVHDVGRPLSATTPQSRPQQAPTNSIPSRSTFWPAGLG